MTTHFFPFIQRKGHPNPQEQAAMAEQLLPKLAHIKWD
jgi:hypothetical protein